MHDVPETLDAELVEPVALLAGQRVAILGESPRASEAVTARGAVPIILLPPGTAWSEGVQNGEAGGGPAQGKGHHDGNGASNGHYGVEPRADTLPPTAAPLALAPAAVDHVLIPACGPRLDDRLPLELYRVLRPGGHVVVGVAARPPWRRARSAPGGPAGARLAAVVRWLEAGRLAIVARYAIYLDATAGRGLVPLDHPGAVRHFVEHLWTPPARWSGLARRGAALLLTTGRHDWLFERFLVVAERPAAEAGEQPAAGTAEHRVGG